MNRLSARWKGYVLAFVATLSMSNVYLFSKAALNSVHLFQFGTYWFGFAIILNLIYLAYTGKLKTLKSIRKQNLPVLIIIGILETLGTALFFLGLNTMENPANVSFLANLTPLFVSVLGIAFLHDRFNMIEVAGILLTLAGAFILSYSPGAGTSGLLRGSEYILLSSLFFSISLTLAKKNIESLDPGILSLNRVIYLFLFMLTASLISGRSLIIPGKTLLYISLGSFLGPFLSAVVQYSSLKYIEASRSMLIQSSKGLFVLLGAFLVFGILPGSYQIGGGLLTITGIFLIITGKQGMTYFYGKYRRPQIRKTG